MIQAVDLRVWQVEGIRDPVGEGRLANPTHARDHHSLGAVQGVVGGEHPSIVRRSYRMRDDRPARWLVWSND